MIAILDWVFFGALKCTKTPMKSEILCVQVELAENDAGQYWVRLSGDGFESVEDEFAFEVPENSQLEQKIEAIEGGTCVYDDLNYAGTRLWLGLMTGKCKTAWESLNQTRKVGVWCIFACRCPRSLSRTTIPLTCERYRGRRFATRTLARWRMIRIFASFGLPKDRRSKLHSCDERRPVIYSANSAVIPFRLSRRIPCLKLPAQAA